MFSLKNKRIVVTGGCGLIGRSTVEQCLQWGAKVIVLEANIEDKLRGRDGLELVDMDITKLSHIEKFLQARDASAQPLTGWVNAAYPHSEDWGLKLEDLSYASWRENVDLQLNATCEISRLVSLYFRKHGGGSLVNLGSIYGSHAPDFSIYEGTDMTMPAPYAAIKGGLHAFSKYLAAYFGQDGVRVNCVSPGGVFNNQAQSFVEAYSKRTMLGRMAKDEEVAAPIAFLLSDASAYITGQNIFVDGGWGR